MTDQGRPPMSWRTFIVATLSLNLSLGLLTYVVAGLVKWGLFR